MQLEKFYDKAYDWILNHGPKIILGIIVLIIGQWFIKFCRKWVRNALHRRELNSSLQPFLQSLLITVLQILLILVVMQIIGIQLTVFTALIASMGVAAGLALSGTLQNFAGGVLILLLKPFRVGDNILAQGQDGIVSSIEIFYTVLTTFDNKTVIIPNSKLSNEVIINISREGKRRLDVEVKFSYGLDLEKIKEVIHRIIEESPELLKEPAPNVGISVLEPDGFKVIIEVWVEALKYYDVKLAFQQRVVQDLKEAGLKLPGM